MMGKFFLAVCCSWFCLFEVSASGSDTRTEKAEEYLNRAKLLYERSEYDSLPYYYRYSEVVFDGLNQYEKSAECMLGMVDYYRMKNQQSHAAQSLESAESYIKKHIGLNTQSWADALFIRGKLYQAQNREKEAITVLNTCLDLQEILGGGAGKTARFNSVLGAVYYTYGDLDSAEYYYSMAYDAYMEISADPSMEKGILLFNLGLLFSQGNQKEKWAEYTLRGIENNIILYGPDFPDLSDYYSSLSSYYITSGKLDSATKNLDRAERIMINAYGDDYFELSGIYINRARIYRINGDFQASLEYYLQALKLLEAQEIPDRLQLNTLNINIARLYKALGEYQTSYQYLLKLLKAENHVHPAKMAVYYSSIADIEIHLGNYSEAEDHLNRVFELREKYFSEDYFGLAFDYETYGILLDSTKRFQKASEYYHKALEISRQSFGDFHSQTAKMYKNLGDHYLGMHEYQAALEQYQHSIRSIVPEYNLLETDQNPDPQMVPDLMFYLKLLKQKAVTLENLSADENNVTEAQDRLYAAFMAYNASIEVSEILRNSYLNDESKLYLSENERITYEKGVQAAYNCYELSSDPEFLAKAFQIAEKGKYATLQSVLAREDALVLSGIPDSVLELESGMQKQLAVFQELLNEGLRDTLPDQVKLQEYRDQLFRLKDRIAGFHRSLEFEYPDYFELLYNVDVIDPGRLSSSLGRKDKIIEYFFASGDLFVFEISREGIACRRESADSLFYNDLDLVERYIFRHESGDPIQDDHLSFIESSSRLYERLILSVKGYENLVIIPEGKLSYFPFDVLITEPVPEFSGLFRDVPFLISSHSIRYGYSATLLEPGKGRKAGNLNRFIGFAPGYLSRDGGETISDPQREIVIDRQSLDALPGSIDEVIEIGELLRGTALIGSDASEKKFKQIAEEGHIIHLATHAFLDDQDPLKSILVFSDNQDAEDDGFLNVYELYNMELNARLVVLSACNTGSGEMRGGEGIMSLARAFFYAGVPNIVMTLWTVSDRQSHKLMVSFYKNLKKGRKAEVSLRRAKLDFLENALPGYQNPRYWAGYILVGNPENLFLPYWFRQIIALTGIILVLLAGGMMIRKNSMKKSGAKASG